MRAEWTVRTSPTRRAAFAGAALGLWIWLGASLPAFAQAPFTLTSKDLDPRQPLSIAQVYDSDGCHGKNQSPELQWSGAPAGTKSFAITMFDPDAAGPGWWHWAVTGIPADTHELPTNASASGSLKRLHAVEASNDFARPGYGGPCPPPGKPHRYIVTVYALKTTDLRLTPGQPAPMFDHEIGTTVLGRASITVTYGR
jgi:Raf kinase inhibitor-like YbhB/YbcL family protein